MGLIPSSELPDVRIFADATPGVGMEVQTCASVTAIPAADIVTFEGGERDPDAASTSNDLDIPFVILSPDEFTAAEIDYFDRAARWHMSDEGPTDTRRSVPVPEATGGLAEVSTEL